LAPEIGVDGVADALRRWMNGELAFGPPARPAATAELSARAWAHLHGGLERETDRTGNA
jgi:hypothetical protein